MPRLLKRGAGCELQTLQAVTRFGVERLGKTDAQRPEWRLPIHPKTGGVAHPSAGRGSYPKYLTTVDKGSQTISFTSTAPTIAIVGGATYTPTATATSGLTVALTVDAASASICSISGSMVSFNTAGTCLVE